MRGGEEEGLCDDIVRALGHLWSFSCDISGDHHVSCDNHVTSMLHVGGCIGVPVLPSPGQHHLHTGF